jgi:hypothetical protein
MSNGTGPSQPPYPRYIEHGGTQVFRQPLALNGVTLHGFVLDAEADALQALCTKMLNGPAGGRARYLPLLPKVLLVFAAMDAASSTDPVHRNWGYVPEIDVSFFVPVAVLEPDGDGWEVVDLAWYLPYVFVDNSLAVATGREIYGFQKELGTFTIPSTETGHGAYTASTLVLDPFKPQTRATERQVLQVRRNDSGAVGLEKEWDDVTDAIGELFGGISAVGEMVDQLDGTGVDLLDLTLNLFSYVKSTSVPMVFLKQFRDATDPTRACYQRVVTARADVDPTSVRHAGPLWGDYTLTLADFASHPIASDLGLKVGDNHIDHAFRLEYSFEMLPGAEV